MKTKGKIQGACTPGYSEVTRRGLGTPGTGETWSGPLSSVREPQGKSKKTEKKKLAFLFHLDGRKCSMVQRGRGSGFNFLKKDIRIFERQKKKKKPRKKKKAGEGKAKQKETLVCGKRCPSGNSWHTGRKGKRGGGPLRSSGKKRLRGQLQTRLGEQKRETATKGGRKSGGGQPLRGGVGGGGGGGKGEGPKKRVVVTVEGGGGGGRLGTPGGGGGV